MHLSNEQKDYIKRIKFKKRFVLVSQIILGITFLLTWELCSKYKIINSFIFSSPLLCFKTIWELLITGELLTHFLATMIEIVIAFVLGAFLGLGIAILLYLVPILNKIIDPYLTMINSLPKVALGPMLIIWCGANNKTIIFMALLINLIVSILTILNGFKNADKIKLKLLNSFGANKIDIMRYLILPGSIGTIMSSLKLNISMTLIGVIMGEFLVSKRGIGYLIIYGTQVFNLNLVISGIFILLFISYLMFIIVSLAEKFFCKYK